jgi:hypothetical protein
MASWIEKVSHLRAVLFEEGDSWSAQCLDYDVAAQAETLWELPEELARVLAIHIAASAQMNREPFAGIPAAPLRFWELFERGNRYEGKLPTFKTGAGSPIPNMTPDLRIARSPAAL